MDFSPARWIWLPSQRCLPNTFVLFRREVELNEAPTLARGWVTADSRYRLSVNGMRVQWGPSPCDPRWPEADPCDLAEHLRAGLNVIGIEACYFGRGDGTWPGGAPGVMFRLDIDGEVVASDASWRCRVDRGHPPGMYPRWFLRALQEEFDAREHPAGWDRPSYESDEVWVAARELPGPVDGPAIFAGGPEYLLPPGRPPEGADAASRGEMESEAPALRTRSIPLMREAWVSAGPPRDAGVVRWRRDPADWFESRMPDCFDIERDPSVFEAEREQDEGDGADATAVRISSAAPRGEASAAFVTYELSEQMTGFPCFEIEAPAGTVVELIVRESHDGEHGPLWLDNYVYSWSRLICREGVNRFEAFDWESFQWMQLHIRGADGPTRVRRVGVRRRTYAWSPAGAIRCAEPDLQRLFDASHNTLLNSALETNQDGGARERQQYSGDCGHQQHAIRHLFGDRGHGARYLRTFSQGMTVDGYFLDCWPGYDRLARLMQRQIGSTPWGPILDHGVGFAFDCWHHYQHFADAGDLVEPYPRLRRFCQYLAELRGEDGLLPVERLGVPSVWMDHQAYQRQSHKRCAFNLYAAAMLRHAMAPLAKVMGDDPDRFLALGDRLLDAAVRHHWDDAAGHFAIDDGRTCDRSLATSILFDQCPDRRTEAASELLATRPPTMGLSYPANAVWRYWALAKLGRTDVIVQDLRDHWATMESVRFNNTLQEDWDARRDAWNQFSHCPLAPLVTLYQCIVGLEPIEPGFTRFRVRPQPADLADLDVELKTPPGPIRFVYFADTRKVRLTAPAGCRGELVMPGGETKPWEAEIEAELPPIPA